MANIKLDSHLDSLEAELDSLDKSIHVKPVQETIDMESYVEKLMINSETISLFYNEHKNRAEVYSNVNGIKKTDVFDISSEEYKEICKEYCDDIEDKYNHSNWFENRYGDLVRVFTNLPPVTKYPCITINISRNFSNTGMDELPEKLRNLIPFIMSNRFIIAGQTGSGKTYFLNRALRETFSGKYDKGYVLSDGKTSQGTGEEGDKRKIIIPKNVSQSRIALVEEFHEIFPPNKNTICLGACPVKPGEPNVFAYIVQQTNLMRLDYVLPGEIKGEESFYFMSNLSSGTKGGSSMHAKSCVDALQRLRTLMTLSGHCDLDQAGTIIASALDFVIYIDKHQIKEIKKVVGVYNKQQERFQLDDVYNG